MYGDQNKQLTFLKLIVASFVGSVDFQICINQIFFIIIRLLSY